MQLFPAESWNESKTALHFQKGWDADWNVQYVVSVLFDCKYHKDYVSNVDTWEMSLFFWEYYDNFECNACSMFQKGLDGGKKKTKALVTWFDIKKKKYPWETESR